MASSIENLVMAAAGVSAIANQADCTDLPDLHIVCRTRDTYYRMIAQIKSDPNFSSQPLVAENEWLCRGIKVRVRPGWRTERHGKS